MATDRTAPAMVVVYDRLQPRCRRQEEEAIAKRVFRILFGEGTSFVTITMFDFDILGLPCSIMKFQMRKTGFWALFIRLPFVSATCCETKGRKITTMR